MNVAALELLVQQQGHRHAEDELHDDSDAGVEERDATEWRKMRRVLAPQRSSS